MSNHEAAPSLETESVEVYRESLQRIAGGIKLFREKVVERYLPLFSRLSEKYRVSYIFDAEIRKDGSFFEDKFSGSQNRDLFGLKQDNFAEEIKKIVLAKCPPAPGEISSDELGEILGKTKDDQQVESENELFFGEALEAVASGLSDFEELFKERMLEKVYQYYSEIENIKKNPLVVSTVGREIENLKTFMARNGLNARLEIAGNLSSTVDLILEYLEDQCLNKKHNEDSEKRQEILAVETKPACQPIVEAIRKISGDESRQVTADELLSVGVTRDQFSKLEKLYGLKLLDLDEDGRVGFWLNEEDRKLNMVFLTKTIDEDYETGQKTERYIPDCFFKIPEAF
jgi:nicotinamide mononucleotide adenylyltransferase